MTKDTATQDVEMKEVEKTEAVEDVKKDVDVLTLEGSLVGRGSRITV
jgi:hypothetical protein